MSRNVILVTGLFSSKNTRMQLKFIFYQKAALFSKRKQRRMKRQLSLRVFDVNWGRGDFDAMTHYSVRGAFVRNIANQG